VNDEAVFKSIIEKVKAALEKKSKEKPAKKAA